MILMIDNYDSFTYNIVQYLGELGEELVVHRNDEINIDEIRALSPQAIVISPGPGRPDQAGISIALIRHFAQEIPVLGVCLGHQSIGQAFGARIVRSAQVMHGKTSEIHHQSEGIFEGLSNPFTATRYHSLVIQPETLPPCFEVTAWTVTDDGSQETIMGIRHREAAVQGVQFHPESILTEHGYDLLRNFCRQSRDDKQTRSPL